jgi:hypothetical protein
MLLLTNPFNMGDVAADLTHVNIHRAVFDLERKRVHLEVLLGVKDENGFQPSIPIPDKTRLSITLSGQGYQDFMSTVMSGVGTKLFQYLIDAGHFEGTVE